MKQIYYLLLLCLLITSCINYGTKTSMHPEVQLSGEDRWVVEGNLFVIEKTMIISFPSKENVFAVVVLVDFKPNMQNKNIAKKIAKYSIENGYYSRAKKNANIIVQNKKKIELENKIGISLTYIEGSIFTKRSGYNYLFEIDDL